MEQNLVQMDFEPKLHRGLGKLDFKLMMDKPLKGRIVRDGEVRK